VTPRCTRVPDRLDITREGAPPMQSFGAGAHYCLGANLARREIAEALAVMARRMRNLRRAGPAPWKPLVDQRPRSAARGIRRGLT